MPPVAKDPEWEVLAHYYNTLFFFGAQALGEKPPVYLELEHIYRQSDEAFISILNHLRDGDLTGEDIARLNRHHRADFKAAPGDGYVYLTTHNHKADRINEAELQKLPGQTFRYHAEVEGTFDARTFPLDPVLSLKKDAQVMFIKNDPSEEHRFFNGKIGWVKSLRKDGIQVAFSERIGRHIADLSKQQKGLKKYIRELADLEPLFYGQVQKIYKTRDLIAAICSGEELTKAGIRLPARGNAPKSGQSTSKKAHQPKKKPDTKTVSLQLFDEGKTVEDIAQQRSLAVTTIQGHIAYWVEVGEIDISRLVHQQTRDEIAATFNKLETNYLKPVYEFLAEKYDYGTIKYAAAYIRKANKANQ